MKISIITPSFNQGEFLEETIQSVLNQEYPNLEYIVIDGGSSDASVDVIKKYDQSIDYWVSEPDEGQADAINKGFKRAAGDIITWLNSDDILKEGALKKVNEYFNHLPASTGLIHGEVELFGKGMQSSIDKSYADVNNERYLSGMAFSQPASFFKKEVLDKIGLLNANCHFGMDYDLFSRMSLACDFKKVPDVFAGYRLHEDSKTISQSDQFINDWISIFRGICTFLKMNDILAVLDELGIESQEIHTNYEGLASLAKEIRQELMLFYFLSYVLKSDFWNNNLKRCRRIKDYLKENYPEEIIYAEKDLKRPVKILSAYPIWFISLSKKVKDKLRSLNIN